MKVINMKNTTLSLRDTCLSLKVEESTWEQWTPSLQQWLIWLEWRGLKWGRDDQAGALALLKRLSVSYLKLGFGYKVIYVSLYFFAGIKILFQN